MNRYPNNSSTEQYAIKPSDGPDGYKRLAEATMAAIDAMPKAYQDAVNQFGYVDVYRAWKRGIPVSEITRRSTTGFFRL